MGIKYHGTVRDQKALQRFQERQARLLPNRPEPVSRPVKAAPLPVPAPASDLPSNTAAADQSSVPST